VVPKRVKSAITPQDCVQCLGITAEDDALLESCSIFTVGQLAAFDVMSKLSCDSPSIGRLLDLQEQACTICTEYVTKATSAKSILWGYYYLGEAALTRVLEDGFLDSESLLFLWAPMPIHLYQNCLAIDRLIGKDTSDPSISDRYSRVIKINLTELCEKYGANLYHKDRSAWIPIRPAEAEAWTAVEDMWDKFEPGTDVYKTVLHGKIVVPRGRVPMGCMEFENSVSENGEEEYYYPDHPLSRFLVGDRPVAMGPTTSFANKVKQILR